jgi:hypothetical protein
MQVMGYGHEKPFHIELEPELVAGFARAFIPRFDRYPLQLPDGSYVTVEEPLTMPMIEAHITGTRTIGAYALDTQNTAKWICFDADDGLSWYGLRALHTYLADNHIPSYLETSRRGGHLWLFLEPMSGKDARHFGKHLLAAHNLTTVELYPKQDELRTGPGSLVRLPLGVHRKSKRRYPFISSSGKPLAPTVREQLRILATPDRLSYAALAPLVGTLPEHQPASPTPKYTKPEHVKGETPSARLKNAMSVPDFVGRYVPLDENGRGLCPFHDDHRQSFGVSQDGNYWHCFAGCGGGSIIDFWMKWRQKLGQDAGFTATITELAQMLLG